MSPQGVMTRKKASYSPGLNPVKGKKFCPGTQTGSRDKLSSLSLGITKTSPLGPMLVDQPANVVVYMYMFYLFFLLAVLHRDGMSVDRFSESPVAKRATLLHYC